MAVIIKSDLVPPKSEITAGDIPTGTAFVAKYNVLEYGLFFKGSGEVVVSLSHHHYTYLGNDISFREYRPVDIDVTIRP